MPLFCPLPGVSGFRTAARTGTQGLAFPANLDTLKGLFNMDWQPASGEAWRGVPSGGKRWVSHAGHGAAAASAQGPHGRPGPAPGGEPGEPGKRSRVVSTRPSPTPRLVTLDGSLGEGGGQILRTALTLSLLTGRPFRLVKVRANRDRPGLRPQHLAAVLAAAELADAEVSGAEVGSRDLTFRPRAYAPRDLSLDIGTAGSAALVLQTLHLPLALKADQPVRVTLTGGTFNTRAPSFPFLETTWRAHLAALGAPIALTMPIAGFYPRGGGRLDAWVEPARLRPLTLEGRGRLVRVTGTAGVARLKPEVAGRMRARAEARLRAAGFEAAIDLAEWPAASPGAAIRLSAEHEGVAPATFVGLGERGKPAEAVADEAVAELLAHEAAEGGAVDPHSADQVLIPLALTPGRSEYTVSEVTEHLRTNAQTVRAFLDRTINVEEPSAGRPGRVTID